MNLYHWAMSDALKEYARGDIIVMAGSIEEAKVKARANIDPYLKDARSWWFLADGSPDPEEESYGEFINKLERDLQEEPDFIETGTIYIRGSE